MRSIQSN